MKKTKTIREVAGEMGVTRATVWLWVRMGKIKGELTQLPTGEKLWVIPVEEVERLKQVERGETGCGKAKVRHSDVQ